MNHKTLRKGVFLMVLIGLGQISMAYESGQLGVGIIIGNPTGPTVKYWMSDTTALDLAIGFQEDISVHGDILFHAWDFFPQPKRGKFGAYLGFGPKIQEKKKDDLFGIRAVAGVNYIATKYPFEIFFELVPVFELSPDTDTDLDAGVGVRYNFGLN